MMTFLIQGIYFITFYKQDKIYITTQKNQLYFIEERIQQLNEYANNLGDTQKQLEALTLQNRALSNVIPTSISGFREANELLRYMYANHFMNIRFEVITEKDAIESKNTLISSHTYELMFVGRYEEVRDLIEHLNQSYQMLHIQSLELSNEIQSLDDESHAYLYEYYGEDFYKIVQATLKLTLYTRQDEAGNQEIYQPDIDLRANTEGVFMLNNQEELSMSGVTNKDDDATSYHPQVQEEGDLFILNIADILTSGDTYKFSGPGETQGGYVGLITQEDVKIQLTIKEKEYEMSIEDALGKADKVTVQTELIHPKMHIISTMRSIYNPMPNISIFIDNRTKQVMQISMEGNLIEKIKVFNESGYQLVRGETKGMIKLT